MRRVAATLALAAATFLPGACAYDPYTGAMVPCCNYYGYPYRYPPPYDPYGYPPATGGAPSQSQLGQAQQGQAQQGQAQQGQAQQGYAQPGYAQPGQEPPGGPPGAYPVQPQPGAYPSQEPPGGYPGVPTNLAPPGAYPGQPGEAGSPRRGGSLTLRFAAANVTNDGHLTREQAATGMPFVAQNFDAIDVEGKGYVTLEEIRAFLAERRAARGGRPGGSETN